VVLSPLHSSHARWNKAPSVGLEYHAQDVGLGSLELLLPVAEQEGGDLGALQAGLGGIQIRGIETPAQTLNDNLPRPAERIKGAQCRWSNY